MPPKKRKSAVADESTTEPSLKKARKPVAETATSSRPKRASLVAETSLPEPLTNATKKKGVRGRKPGTTITATPAEVGTPRKRGRPPKNTTTASTHGTTVTATPNEVATPRKRGRPPKNTTVTKSASTETGLKPKPGHPKSISKLSTAAQGKQKKPVGRPPRKQRKFFASKKNQTDNEAGPGLDLEPDLTIEEPEDDAYGDDGRSYWLLKAEPESRIVKGVDVKFSIDDLRAAKDPEPWDGVRNPVARNNLRAMKEGDYAFFYHSSCKVPGIVGLMEIVREHSVDESAFDPNHPYYDEKSSRDKPKWEVVHVEFRRKFDDVLTLETLKSYAKPGAALENMQTLRQSRVSVSRVTPKEWRFIMSLLGESEPETVAGGKVEESPEVKGDEAKELSGNATIDRAPMGSAEDRANGQTTAESRPDLAGADKSEKELN